MKKTIKLLRICFHVFYISIVSFLFFILLYAGFQSGFRPYSGLASPFFLIYVIPLVLFITLIYFISLIIVRLKTKKWIQSKLSTILTILAVLSIFLLPFMSVLGENFAYFYAGFDNIRKDADKLMEVATEDRKELPLSKYPLSFKRVGAGRVFVSNSSVMIVRGGFVSKKYGIAIYADRDHKSICSGAYKERQISNRIFEFELN